MTTQLAMTLTVTLCASAAYTTQVSSTSEPAATAQVDTLETKIQEPR